MCANRSALSAPPLPDPALSAADVGATDDRPAGTLATVHAGAVLREPLAATLLPQLRSLRCGCYLLAFTPTSGAALVRFDGTLRVECHAAGRTASGDLYQRSIGIAWVGGRLTPVLGPAPSPSAGIPIFARSRYRWYLRVAQILEFFTIGNSFTLGFEMYRFTAPNTWSNDGAFTAQMSWSTPPAGYPSGAHYLTGAVRNAAGATVGQLTMGWVSSRLRRAVVEIDRVRQSEAPLDSGTGETWHTAFEAAGWQVTRHVSQTNIAEPSGESWSDAELHAAMLTHRQATNLDTEWRYHLLCVRRLDSTSRGIMYDTGATDSNNVPREGAALASHWTIPDTAFWGNVRGLRFGTATAPYFRTAIHEIGHAMGLFHNTVDNGYMNTTDSIAGSATPGTPFPDNIDWAFAPDDLRRLRHYPDPFVRPGGTAFGTASMATPPISPLDETVEIPVLEVRVRPLHEAVPIGAPVRVTIELINHGPDPIPVPKSLSLKGGHVRGRVTDPSGQTRAFQPLVRCIEDETTEMLDPGQSRSDSLTLLRGGAGALFPVPGVHVVEVEVFWEIGGLDAHIHGREEVIITPPADDAHAEAALDVLSEPDTLLTLVLGGDHLERGIDAIRTALDNPVLRPHFAYVEAKRVAERFGARRADLRAAARLLDESAVMSPAEIRRAARIVQGEGTASPSAKSIVRVLKRKAASLDRADAARAILDEL